MPCRRWSLAAPLVAALMPLLLSPAPAAPTRQLTAVPYDPALSVYVAERGLWLDHSTLRERWGRGECLVAAFGAEEHVTADPETWAQRQINAPTPPFGWAHLEPVTDREMALEFTICDQQRRLGRVVVNDCDSSADPYVAWAGGGGATVTGSCAVAAGSKLFELVAYARGSDAVLLRLGILSPSVDGAVVRLVYAWDVNRGDERDACPVADLSHPGGSPEETEGKVAVGPPQWVQGCAGGNEIRNDGACGYSVAPLHWLRRSQVVHVEAAVAGLSDTESATATSAWQTWEAEQKAAWGDLSQTELALKGAPVPPLSQGVVHFPVRLRPEITALVVFPYQGHPRYADIGAERLQQRAQEQFAAAYGSQTPCRTVARAIADSWTATDVRHYQAGPPAPLGAVWKLVAEESGAPFLSPLSPTVGTALLELCRVVVSSDPFAMPEFELCGGTAVAVLDGTWLDPAPPRPAQTEYSLRFPDDGPDRGRCAAQLPAGWYWLVTAQPNDRGWAAPVPTRVPSPTAPNGWGLHCYETGAMPLEVWCTSSRRPEACQVELQARGVDLKWRPVVVGDTVTQPDGRCVWRWDGLLIGASYRVRARSRGAPDAPWSEWQEFWGSRGSRQIIWLEVPHR
ncbi:MAG: hypothetical protein HPY69_03205 [Armatimonadetes bacterium]|nr:hypothetical protein [Armatimonadota bacterium]